ncbi:response regulator transcription factor [Aurantibacillus circumpalustris]|uniref:response regulator transcription factor n=1 Tax=Aurantibacillus circumpalustris TaxID=3036359 RepID=UPI00295B93B9|nr:response regulator transcription factor [Aurantibacillus circumpalustris]
MHNIKVGIIDDHEAVAQGVSLELKKGGKYIVLFIVTEKQKIIETLTEQSPDVLIMDVVMPGTLSVNSFKDVLKIFPQQKIIAYTALNSPMLVELLFKAGVKGYVNKNQTLRDLEKAVLTVYEEALYLPDEYDFIRQKLNASTNSNELSKREIEILILIALEKKTSEIAAELFISVSTVESHRKNLFEKLNVTNLAGLIKAGVSLGYIH